MSVKEKDMVNDIINNNSSISKEDEKLLKEINELIEEWEKIRKEDNSSFKPNKEDWEGIPSEKHYNHLPSIKEYTDMINDIFVEKGYIQK